MARGHEKGGRLNPRIKFSSVLQSYPTLCHPKDCSAPGFPVHHQLPKLAQTHIHWVSIPSNHLILCCPLLLLPSTFPSIRAFSNESALHIRWPNYWSFSFNISLSNENLDWFPLGWPSWISFQSKGFSSLLQHHSPKASVLQCSALFITQLSHPYMITGKTIALIRWTFVDKVMSLLFNMLSRLVIAFVARSKCLLI